MPERGRPPGKKLEWALGLLALTGMAMILPASEPGAAQHPNLQGTWTLNEDLTARMRENDQQQRGPRQGSGGGTGRHGGGSGGGRGGGRRGGGGFPGGSPGGSPDGGTEGTGEDHPAEAQRPSLTALNTLTIVQKEGQKAVEVTITDQEGRTRVLRTDGSKVRDDKAPGGPAEIQASWDKDGSLVVQVKPEKGPKRTESYIVSDDGKHLYLVLSMEGDGRRPAFKVRRAYDPAPPAEKPATPESGEGDSELA
jgi:hypothetical protein